MSTIVEVTTQQPTVTIEIISQQALTTVETNSFRSVPLGVNLTAEGGGDNYLSDDGTYKPVESGTEQVNSDWNSVSGVSQILNKPALGTASPLNVPASGNAASGEVVKGNDTRLSDARTPTAHSHTLEISDVTGLTSALGDKQPLSTVLTDTTAPFTTALETKLNNIVIYEVEVDFGTKPVRSKKFTISNASISGANKIIVSTSGNVATGRVGDDWEWDSISASAKSGTGQFILTCFASGKVAGKRKFYYTYQ